MLSGSRMGLSLLFPSIPDQSEEMEEESDS